MSIQDWGAIGELIAAVATSALRDASAAVRHSVWTVALGLLRAQLVEAFGLTVTRGLLGNLCPIAH